jgi:hypothetical protein
MAKTPKRTTLDRLLSSDFQDPFMSNQYVITGASIGKSDSDEKWKRWFTTQFFREKTESLDLPFKTIAADDRHWQAAKKFYAGYTSFNSFNATFFENHSCDTMKAFVNWQQLVVSDAGVYRPAKEYQATLIVALLNHQDDIVQSLQFNGVFPTQITNVQLTGSEVTRIQVQVSFSVNNVIWLT